MQNFYLSSFQQFELENVFNLIENDDWLIYKNDKRFSKVARVYILYEQGVYIIFIIYIYLSMVTDQLIQIESWKHYSISMSELKYSN